MHRIDRRRKLFSCLQTGGMTLWALIMTNLAVPGQEPAEKKFFEVKLGTDTGFAFDRLSYKGDFFELEAKAGNLVAGSTEKGTTVVILLGDLQLRITPAKEEFAAAFKEHLGGAPAVLLAKKAYIRLNPGDYAALTQGAKLTPNADENVFKTAKALYDDKFNGSYHAGPLAIIPPARTFYFDLEAEKIGLVIFEEGDFLRLTRVIPYKPIYPSRTPNPKR